MSGLAAGSANCSHKWGSDMGQSIPLVCQDWTNTKAAYRFFSNERINEADILCGHFEATRGRVT
ncbi:transposase DNA-binding-containing protein [Bradyrhizobium sp. CB3481]|uniref:IS4/Tn5 family transposase DNA-binding protein n=1 Tax=Bradyrhizobium sp. CB3481 TaxID=3039158 RepID=UPI0032C23224